MAIHRTAERRAAACGERRLRLWPGIVAAIIVVLARLVVAPFVPGGGLSGLVVGLAGAVFILLWWLFLSRAPWLDRVGGVLLIVLAALLTRLFAHPSISTGDGGGMLIVLLLPATVPPLLVAGAFLSRRSSRAGRWAMLAAAIFLGSGVWMLARTDGVKGEANPQLSWRWTPTAEERLLSDARDETPARSSVAIALEPAAAAGAAADATAESGTPAGAPGRGSGGKAAGSAPAVAPILWSGFRGPARDGVLEGVRINTDWNAAEPTQIWRRRVGPGWSSFAVAGDLIFTQEQRGDHEVISAYRLQTGEPVWRHRDAARFYESGAGAGPRGTPTVHDGRVYAMGATGIVNALDARTGARIWTRNAEADTGAPRPEYGFAGSPAIVGDVLVAAASGRLAAYDLASGAPHWMRKTAGGGYSSPHVARLAGVQQILLMNGGGITSVGLDGTVLWAKHYEDGIGILQPRVLADGVLVASGELMRGLGVRRLAVARRGDGSWEVEERWASRGLKPYFSDFVVHKGHAYGFDGTILSAIDIQTGERVWKGGRYGAGQMLLLPEQDLLLVISEEGELVLVAASPEKHTEIAKFKTVEGKTWNHPVLVGDLLLVRNGEEMAAFRLR